jgi:small-conductance mechanosensitive channel
VAVGIQDALAAANIEVPFPQRDLHLKTVPEESS